MLSVRGMTLGVAAESYTGKLVNPKSAGRKEKKQNKTKKMGQALVGLALADL